MLQGSRFLLWLPSASTTLWPAQLWASSVCTELAVPELNARANCPEPGVASP